MNTWRSLHRYNSLVDEELVPPLMCPDCEKEFTWLIGEDDEPVAFCAWEDKRFFPGAYFWNQVEQKVLENTDDEL